MQMFLIVLGVMLVLVAAMAIGVIMGRKPISGSCGGMSALGMDVACDICKGDKSVCETEVEKAKKKAQGKDLGYDAMGSNH
ncbi:ApbE family protein [Hahella sp. CCB-MM4]|uniref:(Na+)-NQR maturation NqrM n=1 Tax=Hahella sp. (strain CCB-MM4) TaxID=1926491 RepID=UPI000B9A300C|nr:(Na+)-NQR maturation NqrM [Hahella sp. CCB-MM4]OZG73464.1 ApbE family protein [Hahella sp. CCB-MM4]